MVAETMNDPNEELDEYDRTPEQIAEDEAINWDDAAKEDRRLGIPPYGTD